MIEISLEFGPTNITHTHTHTHTNTQTHTLANSLSIHSMKIHNMVNRILRTGFFHNILDTVGISGQYGGDGALDKN